MILNLIDNKRNSNEKTEVSRSFMSTEYVAYFLVEKQLSPKMICWIYEITVYNM